MAYEKELKVAVAAVLKACRVARSVQQRLISEDSVSKSDKSPVTVADYTAQALISKLIFAHFPEYTLIGEEDSGDLKSEAQRPLREKIVSLANEALAQKAQVESDDEPWSIVGSEAQSEESWLAAIDKGDATTTAKGKVWALDPIDGTKGFLRKGQYAVCLALLQDGVPVLGVMGCPNLPVDFANRDGESGVIMTAIQGQGAFQRSFSDATPKSIKMSDIKELGDASFCESVEAGHSDQSTNSKIASLLGIVKEPVRMDSQAKYCSIARGDGQVYLRLPVSKTYQEKIWDHASGVVLVQEAGGKVTDVNGKDLDFTLGRTLSGNSGIVAAATQVHDRVILAVKKARESN